MITVKPEEAMVTEKKKDLLEVGVQDFYFNKLRPYMQDMLLTCRTDGELIRTLEKVINASDSFCQAKNNTELAETYQVLLTGITDKSYFVTGPARRAPEEEKAKIRDLVTKINDLLLIIKCEPPVELKEKKLRGRIGYSPSGENQDYSTHNMQSLNIPQPQKRIPNR